MRHDLPALIRSINLGRLVEEYVPLKKLRTDDYLALCPFHREKTPSFHVHPDSGYFKCFGCGVGGDAIKFYSLAEQVTIGEAIRQLAERFGAEAKPSQSPRQQLQTRLIRDECDEFWRTMRHHIRTIETLSLQLDIALCKSQSEDWDAYRWRENWMAVRDRFHELDSQRPEEKMATYMRLRTPKMAMALGRSHAARESELRGIEGAIRGR